MSSRTRHALRALSTVLIVSGLLMLADAGLTLVWQEPVSAIYASIVQHRLGDDLRKLERAAPNALERCRATGGGWRSSPALRSARRTEETPWGASAYRRSARPTSS